ncbi:MAG TPA: hypothetical protein VFP65_03125 [Anaeromyxobacteraceae bacterium]|nr:hypothetical protein [Anaeromyxobacteraceae bacterium]
MIAAPDRCTRWWWDDRDDDGRDVPALGAPVPEPAPTPARVVLLPPLGPMALPAVIAETAVQDHRSLFCPSYDGCLDHAVVSGWVSWSCAGCPAHRDDPRRPPSRVGAARRAATSA